MNSNKAKISIMFIMYSLSASKEAFRKIAVCIFLKNILKALLYAVSKETRNPGLKRHLVRGGI
jgi:hypothetical protein